MKIDLNKNFVKVVGSKPKALNIVRKLAEQNGDIVSSYSTCMVGRYICYVDGIQKNFKWTYSGSGKELKVIYTDGREAPIEREPKNTYYLVWIEGVEFKNGEKIKGFDKDGSIIYTLKMTDAMRVTEEDIPTMREKLRGIGIADWVVDSPNTFVKTHYAPKGTIAQFFKF